MIYTDLENLDTVLDLIDEYIDLKEATMQAVRISYSFFLKVGSVMEYTEIMEIIVNKVCGGYSQIIPGEPDVSGSLFLCIKQNSTCLGL